MDFYPDLRRPAAPLLENAAWCPLPRRTTPRTAVPLTRLRLGVLGDGPQPVDHVDDEVLLQGEVGVANALGAVDDEHHVQSATELLTVCGGAG